MGTTTRSRGTSIPRTANSYGDEPNDCGDDSAPAFRRIRERRGARRHEKERLPGRVVDVAGAVRRRVRQPGRGGGRRECAQRAHGHPVRGGRQDRLRAGLVPPRRIGPAHARGMAEHPRSDPGPMDREETARPEGRGSLIPTGDFQLGEPYLPSSDGADRARMNDEVEREVRFDGATARLRGRLRPPVGSAWGSRVMTHGRSEDMGSPLLAALAQSASDSGLWALRFNFAFADAGSEPSGGHVDEIADLREAMGYARKTAGLDTVFVAGRGLGAWAAVAAGRAPIPEWWFPDHPAIQTDAFMPEDIPWADHRMGCHVNLESKDPGGRDLGVPPLRGLRLCDPCGRGTEPADVLVVREPH